MKRSRESEVLRGCMQLLGICGILHWRNNTGAVVVGEGRRRRLFRAGLVGSSDVLGVLPGGRFLALECKRPGGRVRPTQRAFLDAVSAAGGLALVVSDIRQLEEALYEEGILP